MDSWASRFKSSWVHWFVDQRLTDSQVHELLGSAPSEFTGSWVHEFIEFRVCRLTSWRLHCLVNLKVHWLCACVWGVAGFNVAIGILLRVHYAPGCDGNNWTRVGETWKSGNEGRKLFSLPLLCSVLLVSALIWSALIWPSLVWSGLVWSGLVWSTFFYFNTGLPPPEHRATESWLVYFPRAAPQPNGPRSPAFALKFPH